MSRRSPWSVLAVLSLVGSLLALSAAPAASKNGEADDRALYSACPPGSALESAGYRDLTGYPTEFEDAINCMTNYGIMPGLLPGLFQPELGVTRQQMALILIRAADPAGIDVPTARDQGFRDIGNLSKEIRDSINQLADLEITLGTTPSTYVPDTVVNRRQMAQFFTRFLALARVGEGGASVESVAPDDTVFDDLRDLPHDPYDAIRTLYELGVTSGTTASTYGPDDPVTRAQMAMFISRMLGHTNARPAGITMQVEKTSVTATDTVDLIVAVRDEDHQPVVDAPIDLFYVARGDDGFGSNGRCGSKAVREAGAVRCSIDLGDETTDNDGNLFYTMPINEDLNVYAWTGDRNDAFDEDSTDYISLEFNTTKAAANFLFTDDMPEGASEVPYGTTVTFTFQLVDEDEKPVSEEDVEIRIETVEDNEGRQVVRRTRTYSADSSGRIQFTFRLTDPDSDDGDEGELKINVLRADEPVLDRTTVRITSGGNVLRWSDGDDEPATLLIEQPTVYSVATDSRSGGRNYVTATLLDQYGDPVRGKRIHFTSNDPKGLYSKENEQGTPIPEEAQNAYRKTTNRSGVASVNYARDSDVTGIEIIYANVEGERVPDASIEHYWVDDIPESRETRGEVVHYDEDRETLVIDEDGTGNLYVVSFDDNDQFQNSGAISYLDFKETLAGYVEDEVTIIINVVVDTNDSDDVNRFELDG